MEEGVPEEVGLAVAVPEAEEVEATRGAGLLVTETARNGNEDMFLPPDLLTVKVCDSESWPLLVFSVP